MRIPHYPPRFGETPKPHVYLFFGEWNVVWPHTATPTFAEYEAFMPWIRKHNGFVGEPRLNSVFYAPVERIQ